MGDWMAYAYPREEDKKNTYVERLDVWFLSDDKPTKRVIFEKRTCADIKGIIDKARAVVELFKLYDDVEFAISDEGQEDEVDLSSIRRINMDKLHYYDYPANKPEVPGMYIIVLEVLDGSGKTQTVHSLWKRNEDGWFDEDKVDLSSMVAYAGPLNKYKED